MTILLDWLAVALVVVTTSGLLLGRDWRWALGFLAVQYLGLFWFTQDHWLISMAAAKLVTGWMVCTTIALTRIMNPSDQGPEMTWLQGNSFRIFSTLLILTITFALAGRTATWLGMSLPVAWGGLILFGMGLLQVGITLQPFKAILGILTFLSGFEVLYSAVEGSVLVAALLAAINLGLALIGAYFLAISPAEESR